MKKSAIGNNLTDDTPMDVVEHLSELRFRLLSVLLLIIAAASVMFYFSDFLLELLTRPFYTNSEIKALNIFNVTEGFSVRLKSAVIASLYISFPFMLFQVWAYVKPAVERNRRNMFRINILFAIVFFYAGSAFAFMLLLPFTIQMLISFIPEKMNNTINASNYMNFIFMMSAGMGAVFELPVVINILTGLGLLTPSFLSKKRKYAVVIIWIVAAVITPADVLSQVAVAVPLMFLYEVAIVFSFFTYRSYRKRFQ